MPLRSDPLHPPLVAVVGGGISGLAAAHRLRQLQPDLELTLFEASDRVGGSLETRRDGDLLLERGADSFITTLPAADELCRELGLGDQLLPTNQQHRRALVVCRGKLQPVPLGFALMAPHSLAAVWRSPILSLRGKLRMMMEPWVRAPRDAATPTHDESVAHFSRRRLGREASERLVEPLIAGIYVADAQRLSLAATQPRFLHGERDFGSLYRYVRAMRPDDAQKRAAGARYDAFVTLRHGVGTLVDALAATLAEERIHLQAAVSSVARSNDRWRVDLRDGRTAEFDAVIVAAAAPHAGTLLANTDARLAAKLRQIHHASSVVVTLTYRSAAIGRPLDAFGFVAPAVERRKLLAASFASQKFPGRAPDELQVIRVFMGGRLQPEMVEWSDAALTGAAADELSDLLDIQGEPLTADVRRWRDAMPQYDVGHVQLVDDIERLVADQPGLQLVGNAYRGVGIPNCIAYARARAEQLHESLLRRSAGNRSNRKR